MATRVNRGSGANTRDRVGIEVNPGGGEKSLQIVHQRLKAAHRQTLRIEPVTNQVPEQGRKEVSAHNRNRSTQRFAHRFSESELATFGEHPPVSVTGTALHQAEVVPGDIPVPGVADIDEDWSIVCPRRDFRPIRMLAARTQSTRGKLLLQHRSEERGGGVAA